MNSGRQSRREIPCSDISEHHSTVASYFGIVFGDFYREVMSVFLTLWTGSEVSSSTSSVPAGGSSTCTWLSPVLPKLRMRLTVPPKAGLPGSLRTTMEGLGDSEEEVASSAHGPMLFMISYPSSSCFPSCSCSDCLGGRDEGRLSPAAVNLSSSGVRTGD